MKVNQDMMADAWLLARLVIRTIPFLMMGFLFLPAAAAAAAAVRSMSGDPECHLRIDIPVFHEDSWDEWFTGNHGEGARIAWELNTKGLDAFQPVSHSRTLPLPAFLMNLAHSHERRASAMKILASVGFSNLTVVHGRPWRGFSIADLLWSNDFNVEELQNRHSSGFYLKRALLPFLANTLDQLRLVQQAVESNLEYFAIIEDDIMLASTPEETNCRIAKAIAQLPPTADMLYLEVCYEKCDEMRVLAGRPNLLRAAFPGCSAGIVYTNKGARRLLETAMPIWDGLDVMLPALVARRELEVCDVCLHHVCVCVCVRVCVGKNVA
jgi:GR25 family glycosyltransferase involved in LPS biosynthesis